MQRRGFLTAVGMAATGLAATSPALGVSSENEGIDLGAGPYRTNDQLTADLKRLDAESDRVTLREIGRSAGRNDPIHEVTIGNGSTSVHLITQIHGDEPVGTEAALLELRRLADGDTDEVTRVLDALTLTVVPRVNPDGAMFEANTDDDPEKERLSRRQNTQEWDSGDSRYEPGYHLVDEGEPPGYDLNRDFNIRTDLDARADGDTKEEWWSKSKEDGETRWSLDMPYEDRTLSKSGLILGPETGAVIDSFLRADPDFAITHHHQGLASVPDTGTPPEPSVMSVMAAFGPAYEKNAPYYDAETPTEEYVNPFLSAETSTRSLRLNTVVADALAETTGPWDTFDSVTRYGYTTLWGSYLDALCPQTGAAGMLYEISGQSDEVGSRGFGLKLEATRVGFETTFEALAGDPELGDVDENDYFEIPLAGDDIEESDTGGSGTEAGGLGLDPEPMETR